MMSSLADMEIFARVVATGSMSAAARDLGLSPAVVSKRLGRWKKGLEHAFSSARRARSR